MLKEKKSLWIKAIKWPLYSVAIMPIFISASYNLNLYKTIPILKFIGFTIASILILFWENLTNDLFDSETGIDEFKLHSVVKLSNNKKVVSDIAFLSLLIGLLIIFLISISTNFKIIILILAACFLGYLYQGPPFRLGYVGLGEPLCWVAFGPFAHAAALIALQPINNNYLINWEEVFLLGTGPALSITLVLFCSHFHQIKEDKKYGKNSPLVLLGAKKASKLVPWIILVIYLFQFFIIFIGFLPPTCFLYFLSTISAVKLINLLKNSYDKPNLIKNCKFIAIKFQTINGIGLISGLLINCIS